MPDTRIGAFALRTDRLPPRDTTLTPAQTTAKAAVRQAEPALHSAEAKVAGINAGVEAQPAQISFLTGIRLDGAGATADTLSGISAMIGTEVLTARLAALAAQAGLPAANDVVTTAQETLTKAQGDRGAVTTSTRLEAKATLKVENLTGESWPIHLLDQIPCSEQEDLQITFTADPEPTAQDV